jgi:carbonic anhydrase
MSTSTATASTATATVSIVPELLAANARYAVEFATTNKGQMPTPPARKLAVLTCMDARLDPHRFLGLAEGDAHIIRNGGGCASDDALRSLIISQQLLGTREIVVVHHTECGMLGFSNDSLRQQLSQQFEADASGIDFLPFTDLEQSVRDDIAAIRAAAFIPDDIVVSGFIYDVHTGRLQPVE